MTTADTSAAHELVVEGTRAQLETWLFHRLYRRELVQVLGPAKLVDEQTDRWRLRVVLRGVAPPPKPAPVPVRVRWDYSLTVLIIGSAAASLAGLVALCAGVGGLLNSLAQVALVGGLSTLCVALAEARLRPRTFRHEPARSEGRPGAQRRMRSR